MTPISGRVCCSGAPRPPSRSEAKPVAHPTTINLTASLVVSVTLHASGGCRSKFLRRALTRNCLAALLAGLTPCATCWAHAMRHLRVFRNASCWAHAMRPLLVSRKTPCRAHAMRLAELPVKLCPSPTPFPLPSKAWQSPSGGLWEETGVRPGNRSNRSENRSVPSRNRSNRTKNPAFGLENRSRLSQRTGRTRIGGHPRQNRRTAAPESGDQPHLIAQTPTWRTSKPQFGSRICILGVAGLPYNL